MPDEKIIREKIVELYDAVETAKKALAKAEGDLWFARSFHTERLNDYERALKAWNDAIEKISKELTK